MKKNRVRGRAIPVPSLINEWTPGDFSDCHEIPLCKGDAAQDAITLMVRVFGTPPRWVRSLMNGRNRLVGWLGLKNDGAIGPAAHAAPSPAQYQVGDRFGLFTVFAITPDEAIIGVDDRHLDVRISLCRTHVEGQVCAAVSTVVHIHNTLGRVYMAVVGPAHRIIAPATLQHGLG